MDLSEVEKFEQRQRVRKPSEMMRAGAKIRGQCRAATFKDGKSCAIGAALEGGGFIGYDESAGEAPWSELAAPLGITVDLLRDIARKNDRGWTRECIADWLESQGM